MTETAQLAGVTWTSPVPSGAHRWQWDPAPGLRYLLFPPTASADSQWFVFGSTLSAHEPTAEAAALAAVRHAADPVRVRYVLDHAADTVRVARDALAAAVAGMDASICHARALGRWEPEGIARALAPDGPSQHDVWEALKAAGLWPPAETSSEATCTGKVG